MVYDLSDTRRGVRDCPKCRHTMARLREHTKTKRNEGYLLDYGDPGSAVFFKLVFDWIGDMMVRLYRHTVYPLISRAVGHSRDRRHERILKAWPDALICPYCGYILKRK